MSEQWFPRLAKRNDLDTIRALRSALKPPATEELEYLAYLERHWEVCRARGEIREPMKFPVWREMRYGPNGAA